MRKLRIILKSKILFMILFFISLLNLYIYLNKPIESSLTKDKTTFLCIVTDIVKDKTILDCDETVESNSINNIEIGDILRINGILKEYESTNNFNLFNYKEYQNRKGIFYKLKINTYKKISESKKISLIIKKIINNRVLNLKCFSYLKTFILGDKSYIETKQIDAYKKVGIVHLFSISGMHLSLLFDLIDSIYLKNNKKKTIISISFVFLYYSLIKSISLFRCLMFKIIRNINSKLKLNYSKEKEIIISFILIILLKPMAILDTGFYYSFIISSGIILINKKCKRIDNKLLKTIIITLFAFIISIPLNIYQNYEINLLSFIFNLILIPYISLIVFPLSLITLLIPFLDNILLFFIYILEFITNLFCSISIILIFKKPSLIFVIIYYLVILISLYRIKYLYLFVIMLFSNYNYNLILKSTYIIFIDVGQGDSILYHSNNTNILIDTGGNNYSNISKNILIPLIKSYGIRSVDYLIITHGDNDHMGEAINLVNEFNVKNVIFNCGEYNELEQELIIKLEKKKIKYYSCINRLKNLLFLQTKIYDNENDNSNVIYTEINGYKLMFMGDAEIDKEKDIIDDYSIDDIDVLKAGHHGSKTSSSEDFIKEIDPKYSIISVGKNNRYGHPNKETLNNLKYSKIYRTDMNGSIILMIKNDELKIEPYVP